MLFRISCFLILLFSALFMPFWMTLILAILGITYFSYFAEAVIVLFISDLLYGTREERLFNMYFVSFFIALIVLLLIEFMKKKIRIKNND